MTAFLGAMEPHHSSDMSHFRVTAVAEASVLPRVIEVFAKLTLVPAAFASETLGDRSMRIDVRMPGLDQAQSDHLARALRQIIGVETVLVSLTPGAATDQSGAA